MKTEEFMDARCILLCKSFQGKKNYHKSYDELFRNLKEDIGSSFKQYYVFGEYNGVFSFKIQNSGNNLLMDIENNNKLLAKQMSDSIFFKSLYLVYPANEKYTEETDKFWNAESPFFLTTIIHMNHCCATLGIKKSGREYIIKTIDAKKQNPDTKWNFRYRVYYSLDLSDYIIVWKTEEPAHVLEAIRYLYEFANIIGYTNTICALPTDNFNNINKIKSTVGNTAFSMSIQAVAKSYSEAQKIHTKVVDTMKYEYKNIPKPYFSMGNDDYLGFFPNVSPKALYDLYYILINEPDFDKAILSLNTTLAIEGYTELMQTTDSIDNKFLKDFQNIKEFKNNLSNACYTLKEEYLELFINNAFVFEKFFWKKTLIELLVLLDNMSKSTVFDSACFLFFDSANLFLSFLKHLSEKYTNDNDLIYALTENELHIESFIREWEQLINHVVQIDGAFQKTPGYEPLNYNISESIVEFHNAFAQKVINYFSSLDENDGDTNSVTKISSFVVPKLCRRFKTAQWFYDKRENDSLLFITIPVSRIFKSFSNMIALTHEICHYCSNDVRLRTCRTEAFLLCLASLLCSNLQINSNETIKTAFEMLKVYFEKENGGNYNCYISDLSTISKKIAFRFLDKADNLNKLFCIYLNDYKNSHNKQLNNKASLAMEIHRISTHLLSVPSLHNSDDFKNFCSIYNLIDDLILLIKEGYADLMMIYVLMLTPKQYLKESFRDLVQIDLKTDREKVFNKYQRVLVVFETLIISNFWTMDELSELTDNIDDFDTLQQDFCKEFLEVFYSWHNNNTNSKNYWELFFNDDILYTIVRYLHNCINMIKQREQEHDSGKLRNEIAKLFNIMTSENNEGLFSNDFQNELQNNREKVLEKWQNRFHKPYTFG